MSKTAWTVVALMIVTTLSGCAYTIETGPQGTRQAASIGVPAIVGAPVVARGVVPAAGFYGGPYYGYGAGFVGAPIGWGWGGFGWGGGFWDGHHHHDHHDHHDHNGHHGGNDINNFNNDGDVNFGDGGDGGDGGGDGGDVGGDGGSGQ